jgi:hypothetical protein
MKRNLRKGVYFPRAVKDYLQEGWKVEKVPGVKVV